eukprot:7458564-Ditylum_brightwellii.AAC.1
MLMKKEYLQEKKFATLGRFGTLVMNTHGAVWCMYLMPNYKIALVPFQNVTPDLNLAPTWDLSPLVLA